MQPLGAPTGRLHPVPGKPDRVPRDLDEKAGVVTDRRGLERAFLLKYVAEGKGEGREKRQDVGPHRLPARSIPHPGDSSRFRSIRPAEARGGNLHQ